MHNAYRDIRSRIAQAPAWWDENAVPRYDPFTPDQIAYIYADECALVMIACQGCGAKFTVAFSTAQHREFMALPASEQNEGGFVACKDTLAKSIRGGSLHYGDPPNSDCCAAGATMNSEDIRVLQYWRLENFEWSRVSELEVILPDHPEYKQLGANGD